MELSVVQAADLLALADEEIVPLAAEMARELAPYEQLDTTALVERLTAGYQKMREVGSDGSRNALVHLLAGALMTLSIAPRDTVLRQRTERTRPISVTEEEFMAFRTGRLRHVSFCRDTFDAPSQGDVVRLLETNDRGWTGRDTFAEVLYVTIVVEDERNPLYVVSLRPWRGAGTGSFDAAHCHERAALLREALSSVETLYGSTTGMDKQRVRVAANAIRKAITIFTSTVHPAIAAE